MTAAAANVPTIAYLTSAYARAADTFIRGEVEQLRAMGFVLHTFSVRRSAAGEAVSEDIKREQENTEYLFHKNAGHLVLAMIKTLATKPARFFAAATLAWRTSAPGVKARVRQFAYLLEACLLAERMAARGVRHLHNHIGENSAAVAMLASVVSGVPYSLTIHGPSEFDRPGQLALGDKVARAAFVVVVSDFGKSQLFRWCDRRHWDKIKVVRCGVNGTFLRAPPTPVPQHPRMVSIGRIAEQKGQLLLVEAAAKVAAQGEDFELVLIGDGPMRDEVQRRIDRLGLQSNVRIAGWMTSEQVRDELVNSRAMILPSFAEGLPVVIMESMALSRPVVSTYVGGIPELVRHGENGWLVPAGSVDELAAAMREVIRATPEQLGRMGAAGAARVAERHDAATELSKLAELIRRSLGGATNAGRE
jgi:glycosyltransferase involved in cell wall biosynthesis